ncbi:Y+L amino acid transporter 2-like [Glandiceps talaboti]
MSGSCFKRSTSEKTENSHLLGTSFNAADAETTTEAPQCGSKNAVVLKKTLTTVDGVAFMVGTIIGAGIFVSPTGVFINSGSPGAALLIWAAGGLVSLLGALSFTEFGITVPKSGSFYVYILEAFGPLLAFLNLWINVTLVEPASLAIRALTFSEYVTRAIFLYQPPPPAVFPLIAVTTICFVTYINCLQIKSATVLQIILTSTKVAALCVVIVTGMVYLGRGETDNLEEPFTGDSVSASQIASAFLFALYAYDGWTAVTFVTEELVTPTRMLLRSVLISVPIVTIVYILTNLAYFVVLQPHHWYWSDAVAVTFGEIAFGSMAWIMSVAVAISTLGSMNASLFTISRLTFVGAREGHLPQFLAMINVSRFTPMPAAIFNCTIAILMLTFSNKISKFISFVSTLAYLAFGIVTAGLIYLRYSKPEMKRPLKLPIILHIIFLCVCIFLVVAPIVNSPTTTLGGIGMAFTGIPIYYLFIYQQNITGYLQPYMDKVTRIIQCTLIVVYPEEDYEAS